MFSIFNSTGVNFKNEKKRILLESISFFNLEPKIVESISTFSAELKSTCVKPTHLDCQDV